MYRFLILILILILILNFFHAHPTYASDTDCPSKTLVNGVADLRCWNGIDVIPLSGDWLLNYETLDGTPVYKGAATLPINLDTDGPEVPFLGRGVYRATIQLSEPSDNIALQLSHCYMARKVILVDSTGQQKILFDSGSTENTAHTIVKMRTPLIHLGTMGTQSELIVITNNTESLHNTGEDPLLLGSPAKLSRQSQLLKYVSIVVSMILFFSGS